MLEILREEYDYFLAYSGGSAIMVLYVLSLIYLCFSGKEMRKKLFYPSVVLMLVILNPLCYKLLWSRLLGDVFWRMLWMLPVIPCIAYAAADLLGRCGAYWRSFLLGACLLLVILMSGKSLYAGDTGFVDTDNYYKLPQEALEVSNAILAADSMPRVVAPRSLYCYMRQYDSRIHLMYGRNAQGYISSITDIHAKVAREMEKEKPDYDYVLMNAGYEGYRFVVTYESKPIGQTILDRYGYAFYTAMSGYHIYANFDIGREENAADGQRFRITQYGRNGSNYMIYTLEDREGNLVIVDGGGEKSSEDIRKIIREHGNHVLAWIITNYDAGHTGAFNNIMEKPGDIIVDTVYTMKIDMQKYVESIKDESDKQSAERACALLQELDVQYVKEGDIISLMGLKLEVLSAWDETTEQLAGGQANAGSMCFILMGEKEKMLFCSNITADIERKIRDRYADRLPVQYLQAARQGKNGLSSRLQHKLRPNVVFFDIPEKTMDEFSEDDKRVLLRDYYLVKRGCTIYYYSSAPNTIILE